MFFLLIKDTKPRRKKENKEPTSKLVQVVVEVSERPGDAHAVVEANGSVKESSHLHNHHQTHLINGKTKSSSSSTSSSSTKTSSSSASSSTTIANVKKSQKSHHARSIKELSSALNLSASLSTSFSGAPAQNGLSKCNTNRKITDYFQIRKSSRKCKSDLDKERHDYIEQVKLLIYKINSKWSTECLSYFFKHKFKNHYLIFTFEFKFHQF